MNLTCPHCRRPLPATKLELWMEQNGYTYQGLADQLSTCKSTIWRINHAAPGWHPSPGSRETHRIRPLLLAVTGLRLADFCNELPSGGGYSAGNHLVTSDVPLPVAPTTEVPR